MSERKLDFPVITSEMGARFLRRFWRPALRQNMTRGLGQVLSFGTVCVGLSCLSLGCSGASDHDEDAEPQLEAPCNGRAQPLAGLRVESEPGSADTSAFGLNLVEYDPAVLNVGNHRWVFEVWTREGGGGEQALTGAAERLEMTPFMPDHGHGTAVAVEVTELAAGRYEFAPVNLRMPGYWEITVSLSQASGQGAPDEAVFGVCVP